MYCTPLFIVCRGKPAETPAEHVVDMFVCAGQGSNLCHSYILCELGLQYQLWSISFLHLKQSTIMQFFIELLYLSFMLLGLLVD